VQQPSAWQQAYSRFTDEQLTLLNERERGAAHAGTGK
jgi:hypothetical protein